jgi:hypothetical protein
MKNIATLKTIKNGYFRCQKSIIFRQFTSDFFIFFLKCSFRADRYLFDYKQGPHQQSLLQGKTEFHSR